MSRRWVPRLLLVVLAALVVVAIYLWVSGAIDAMSRDAEQVAAANKVRSQRLQRGLTEANQRIRRLGGRPVSLPNVPPPSPGPAGIPGLTGPIGPSPTQTQVNQAVASYCQASDACQGPQGAAVSAAQVAAAVLTYCDPRGDCQGPRGAAGEASTVPGPAGADSTVPGPKGDPGEIGPAGPPPTAEAVAAAVADYCARPGEPCRGPAGPPGADSTVPGPPGPPGPTCPDGFGQERLTVVTPQGGTRDILTCTPA